ncbi:hypothetical protein ADMFC3_12950 [Geovibrio sp. ADMFC3]
MTRMRKLHKIAETLKIGEELMVSVSVGGCGFKSGYSLNRHENYILRNFEEETEVEHTGHTFGGGGTLQYYYRTRVLNK